MIEIEEEKYHNLITVLKRATHRGFENCSAEICELITRALRAVNELGGTDELSKEVPPQDQGQ